MHEGAYLNLRQSVVSGTPSSGLAVYDFAVAQVANSLFERSEDDALYADHDAVIQFTNGQLRDNRPFAARAVGRSTIAISHSALAGNAGDTLAKDDARVRLGADVVSVGTAPSSHPLALPSALAGQDNPHLRKFGQASSIGPIDGVCH